MSDTPYLNLGIVSAYADAKRGGYTGTYNEFCALLAGIGGLQPKLTAGQNISIAGNVIGTKAFPCNPNLLANGYFGQPVNSKGQTTYPGGGIGIDKWTITSGNSSLVVSDGYLTVNTNTDGAAVDQYFDAPFAPGTVLTLSALMRCGTAGAAGVQFRFSQNTYSDTAVLAGTNDWELVTMTVTVPSDVADVVQSARFRGKAANMTYNIKAIKLELGSVQTLAHQDADGAWVLNEIPDYNVEAVRCGAAYMAGQTNPNLLDNWYFPHPVNQRGQTVYTGAGYCIDRWKLTNASAKLTVGSGGVTLGTTGGNVWMQSYLEDGDQLLGKTVTVSLLADGALYTASGMLPVEAVTANTGFMTSGNVGVGLYKTADGRVFVQIGNKSGADAPLTAVKLELGSVQTLAHQDADGAWVLNEIPDYAEQELRCMRYLLRQKTTSKEMFAAMVGSTGRMYFSVPLPVPMRTAPAVTVLAAADLFVAAGRAKLADGVTYDVYGAQSNAVTIRTSAGAVLDYTSGAAVASTTGVFEAALELNAEL